ncbi:MAG: NDP-hexose 2,3-dehydratase family protein [Lachnospiraceae bacterium]|jgi:oxidase EvaA|nr:NDP-hexose 2,3-dehydratase family protein [Lachnospiraceae bacterium]
MEKLIRLMLESWQNSEGNVNTMTGIHAWIAKMNSDANVDIKECNIHDSSFWFYDDRNGEILNRKRSFFSIKGMRRFENGDFAYEQPIIIQPEIGYLGIIFREIDGVLNFLMQAKIEPGNVNCVQISPTIQATKSNFTRVHGGKLPTYFSLFEQASAKNVVYDQVQSEQASRFLHKRNRNIIMEIEDEIEIFPNYMWMTLGQIKELMRIDNLVNMDTRTVLAGIPLGLFHLPPGDYSSYRRYFSNEGFYHSAFDGSFATSLIPVFQAVNDFKMFHDIHSTLVPLHELVDWQVDDRGVTGRKPRDFMVRYYDITITGREVNQWTQPLFKAIGQATFALLCQKQEGVMKFLITLRSEIGTMDKVELGPSIQQEGSHVAAADDEIEAFFRSILAQKAGIIVDVILSEEGGRFYHEQNRNVIIEIDENYVLPLPEKGRYGIANKKGNQHESSAVHVSQYFWVDYASLNYLVNINNCLNIQLRNLLSLLPL